MVKGGRERDRGRSDDMLLAALSKFSLQNSTLEVCKLDYIERRERESPGCLLYTSPSPRDKRQSRMPSSA